MGFHSIGHHGERCGAIFLVLAQAVFFRLYGWGRIIKPRK